MSKPRYEVERKPERCPACGHAPVASILRGLFGYTHEVERKLAEGRAVIGGCCYNGDDPMWVCPSCGVEIYKKQTRG